MATNPKIPEPHDHAEMHTEESRQRRFPVPLLALLVAGLILLALIWYLPQLPTREPAPTGAVAPPQPTPGQIHLSAVNLAKSPVGNQVYLEADLHNAGATTINGVLVDVAFPGPDRTTAGIVRVPVVALTGEGTVQEPLVQNPIEPNETQRVRIPIENAPQDWNQQLPGVTVAVVTAVAPEGGSAEPVEDPGVTVTEEPPGGGI